MILKTVPQSQIDRIIILKLAQAGIFGAVESHISGVNQLSPILYSAKISQKDMINAKEAPKNTLPHGTIQNFLIGTKWNEDDLKRFGLTT
jgi:hypothetical protein